MPSNSPIQPVMRRIRIDEIYTEQDLMYYQHQRLGESFKGVPGISISPFVFSLLDSLLSRVSRIDSRAFRDLLVVPFEDGYFVTTHIETSRAGDRVCRILGDTAINTLEMEFTEHLRCVIRDQHRNHDLWIVAGRGYFKLVPILNGKAIEPTL